MARNACTILRPQPGPNTLKETRWGGSRLAPLRAGAEDRARRFGESWEFSTLEGSESRADGRALSEALGHALPFLAKLIDTALPLSIQVHPGDDAAARVRGKEEAWVVLDADPGACVLAGLRDGVDRAHLAALTRAAVADPSRGEALIASLTRIDVERGTIVFIPAGTVHAIGGGILLAEIQQPSDCTYRLFDYGSGRELHVDAAIEAAAIEARATVWRPTDPPALLHGVHLDLQPRGPGSYAHDAATHDLLVIAVEGDITVQATPDARLAPGDLCLCTGGPFTLTVGEHALAVVGSLPRP